jgi:hypothetical protein
MIYCIGKEEAYERYFQEQERPHKSGRNLQDGYPGGSVWEAEEDARNHCPAGYQVYGVLAHWRIDTEPSKVGNWDDLLIDAELVQLNNVQV